MFTSLFPRHLAAWRSVPSLALLTFGTLFAACNETPPPATAPGSGVAQASPLTVSVSLEDVEVIDCQQGSDCRLALGQQHVFAELRGAISFPAATDASTLQAYSLTSSTPECALDETLTLEGEFPLVVDSASALRLHLRAIPNVQGDCEATLTLTTNDETVDVLLTWTGVQRFERGDPCRQGQPPFDARYSQCQDDSSLRRCTTGGRVQVEDCTATNTFGTDGGSCVEEAASAYCAVASGGRCSELSEDGLYPTLLRCLPGEDCVVPTNAGRAICQATPIDCYRIIAPEVSVDCAAFGRPCDACYAASGSPCLPRTEDCAGGTLCPVDGICP